MSQLVAPAPSRGLPLRGSGGWGAHARAATHTRHARSAGGFSFFIHASHMSERADVAAIEAARAAAVERAVARTAEYQAADERNAEGIVDWAAARERWGDDFERLNSKLVATGRMKPKVEFSGSSKSS